MSNELALLKQTMNGPKAQADLERVLGENKEAFVSSVISLTSMTPALQKCNPGLILAEAMKAATLGLPIDANLGFSYIIPYGGKPQFQIGYKGMIQLAQNTGEYNKINAIEIKDGEFIEGDRLKEDFRFEFIKDEEKRAKTPTTGYAAYFRTVHGFEKIVYMSKEEVHAHGKKFSKSYGSASSGWQKFPDAMCLKTVLKMALKWGPKSVKAKALNSFVENDPDTSKDPLDPNNEIILPEKDKKEPAKNPAPKPAPEQMEPEPEMPVEEGDPGPVDAGPSQPRQQSTGTRKPVFEFEKNKG